MIRILKNTELHELLRLHIDTFEAQLLPYWGPPSEEYFPIKDHIISSLSENSEGLFYWENNKLSGGIIFEYLEFDSKIYEKKIGKINWIFWLNDQLSIDNASISHKVISEFNDYVVRNGYEHFSFRFNAKNLQLINLLIKNNFMLMDYQVTLIRKISKEKNFNICENIFEYSESDLYDLKSISNGSFLNSRLYMDENLDNKKTDLLHELWVGNDCSFRADKVFVYKSNNNILGYITLLRNSSKFDLNELPIVDIDLLVVSKQARGLGIGKKLVSCSINWAQSITNIMTVKTQANNFPALKVYQSNGFSLEHLNVSLHINY
jgi:GNAT superfamily N-acetyltransferase